MLTHHFGPFYYKYLLDEGKPKVVAPWKCTWPDEVLLMERRNPGSFEQLFRTLSALDQPALPAHLRLGVNALLEPKKYKSDIFDLDTRLRVPISRPDGDDKITR